MERKTVIELTKKVVGAATYCDMITDTNEVVEYTCEVMNCLSEKNAEEIYSLIVKGLMQNYRDTECKSEMEEIESTIKAVIEYLAN